MHSSTNSLTCVCKRLWNYLTCYIVVALVSYTLSGKLGVTVVRIYLLLPANVNFVVNMVHVCAHVMGFVGI